MVRKILSFVLCISFLFQQVGLVQAAGELNISGYFNQMRSTLMPDKFRPVHLRYFSYDTTTDNFTLLLDKGDAKELKAGQLQQSSKTLLNYFLIGVSLPNESFWVNLRPDKEDQIIDDELAKTDVGKIMLEADLQLKKDTARFTSPQTPEGREYWNKLYQKAGELFGSENITIPTITRPWIVPNEIIIREAQGSAYIYKATLKVMLEQDHIKDSPLYNFSDPRLKVLNEYSSELIRESIIPKLTKEVNIAKRYAPLRQAFYSLVLSRWFKSRFAGKAGTYASRIDSKNLIDLTSREQWSKTTYFQQYKKSFQDGEYNIKEPAYTPTGQVIRSYFSGGIDINAASPLGQFPGIKDMSGVMAGSQTLFKTDGSASPVGDVSSSLDAQKNIKTAQKLLADVYGIVNMNKSRAIGEESNLHQEFEVLLKNIGYNFSDFLSDFMHDDEDGADLQVAHSDIQQITAWINDLLKKLEKEIDGRRDNGAGPYRMVVEEFTKSLKSAEGISAASSSIQDKAGLVPATGILKYGSAREFLNKISTFVATKADIFTQERELMRLGIYNGNRRSEAMTLKEIRDILENEIRKLISQGELILVDFDPQILREGDVAQDKFGFSVFKGKGDATFYLFDNFDSTYSGIRLQEGEYAYYKIVRPVPAIVINAENSIDLQEQSPKSSASPVNPMIEYFKGMLKQRNASIEGIEDINPAAIGHTKINDLDWNLFAMSNNRYLELFIRGNDIVAYGIVTWMAENTILRFQSFDKSAGKGDYWTSIYEERIRNLKAVLAGVGKDISVIGVPTDQVLSEDQLVKRVRAYFGQAIGWEDAAIAIINKVRRGQPLSDTEKLMIEFSSFSDYYSFGPAANLYVNKLKFALVPTMAAPHKQMFTTEERNLLTQLEKGKILSDTEIVFLFAGRGLVSKLSSSSLEEAAASPLRRKDIFSDDVSTTARYLAGLSPYIGNLSTSGKKQAATQIFVEPIVQAFREIISRDPSPVEVDALLTRVAAVGGNMAEEAQKEAKRLLKEREDSAWAYSKSMAGLISSPDLSSNNIELKAKLFIMPIVMQFQKMLGDNPTAKTVQELMDQTGPVQGDIVLATTEYIEKATGTGKSAASPTTEEAKQVSSPTLENQDAPGGIDFRAMDIKYEPMGTFKGLNFTLPILSSMELAQINIDDEITQIKTLVQQGIIPSGQRVKELAAACSQKGEMSNRINDLIICLVDICRLEEESVSESSAELKETLVILDSGNFAASKI